MRKPHNTADTSIEAYKHLKATGKLSKIKIASLEILNNNPHPCSCRMIALLINKEPSTITSALKSLTEEAIIRIAYKRQCEFTGHSVRYYALNNHTEIN